MKRLMLTAFAIVGTFWSASSFADVSCSVDAPQQTGGSWDVMCSDDGNGSATKYWCTVGINITTTNSADSGTLMISGNVAQNQQNAGIWFASMYQGDLITDVELGQVDCDGQDDGN